MDNCPKCKSSWIGEEIHQDLVKWYGATHWRREIGIDGDLIGIYDGVVAIKCPDCDSEFPRSNSKWAIDLFNKYKNLTSEK
jgi:hypothetical protein